MGISPVWACNQCQTMCSLAVRSTVAKCLYQCNIMKTLLQFTMLSLPRLSPNNSRFDGIVIVTECLYYNPVHTKTSTRNS